MVTVEVKLVEFIKVVEAAGINLHKHKGNAKVYINTDTRDYMESIDTLYYSDCSAGAYTTLHVDIMLYNTINDIANVKI